MSKGCGKNIDGWHSCGRLEMGSEIVPLCNDCEPKSSGEKFTQGEWTHHLDGTIRNGDCTQIIGTYTMSGPFRNGEQKANAHLISAAPKMYHLLVQCEAIIRQNKANGVDGAVLAHNGRKFGADSLINEISKQLAEARGES